MLMFTGVITELLVTMKMSQPMKKLILATLMLTVNWEPTV